VSLTPAKFRISPLFLQRGRRVAPKNGAKLFYGL